MFSPEDNLYPGGVISYDDFLLLGFTGKLCCDDFDSRHASCLTFDADQLLTSKVMN